jgi:hypothetical protein
LGSAHRVALTLNLRDKWVRVIIGLYPGSNRALAPGAVVLKFWTQLQQRGAATLFSSTPRQRNAWNLHGTNRAKFAAWLNAACRAWLCDSSSHHYSPERSGRRHGGAERPWPHGASRISTRAWCSWIDRGLSKCQQACKANARPLQRESVAHDTAKWGELTVGPRSSIEPYRRSEISSPKEPLR